MARLSSEKRRLRDMPWITLTFQQIACMPRSPVKCFGIWSLPWPDTLCLLMYSGLVWLMPQCSESQLAAEALKSPFYTDCFSSADLCHRSKETEWKAGLAATAVKGLRAAKKKIAARGIARCQGDLRWLLIVSCCRCSLTPTQADTHIPVASTADSVYGHGARLRFQHSATPMMHL